MKVFIADSVRSDLMPLSEGITKIKGIRNTQYQIWDDNWGLNAIIRLKKDISFLMGDYSTPIMQEMNTTYFYMPK